MNGGWRLTWSFVTLARTAIRKTSLGMLASVDETPLWAAVSLIISEGGGELAETGNGCCECACTRPQQAFPGRRVVWGPSPVGPRKGDAGEEGFRTEMLGRAGIGYGPHSSPG